ncbi:MAG: tRNA pseudouridine(38-40) synthase TruA [Thermodesulfovibrionia bacterium]|nr:tRNA pseudouridine(38-40) synthase TruA [Thermodesulfovibrionia bacterium]
MRHIKLTLQFDGSGYSGWQVQEKDRTIQGVLESALSAITKEVIRITGCSRTDAGVHALEFVASFKTDSAMKPDEFLRAINSNIPQDIRVMNAEECDESFHPRYDAKSKRYSYIISTAVPQNVFLNRYAWQMPLRNPLDVNAMKEASKVLIGEHDFSSFRASGCGSKHPVRNVMSIEISEMPSIDFMTFKLNIPVIKVSIEANAFLRHMVRNIVGTLVDVGKGRTSPAQMEEILNAKDRSAAGKTAPSCGLFLENVRY